MRRTTCGSCIGPTCSTRPKARRVRRRRPASAATSRPPILEFDQSGTLLRHWGGKDGPGYQWPDSNHGLNIDNRGNIWIGGNGAMDGHVLKFTLDGKFVMQVGKKGVTRNSLAEDHFFQVAKTFFYGPSNEVFVADGYGNRRVAVIDAETGKMKRFWGAYGKPPDDKAALAQGPYDPTATYQHFRGPVHCADVSNDGLVYVCDRTSNRLQIFKTDGTFVKEVYMARDSRADGAVWDTAFSRDAQQTIPLRRRRPQSEGAHLRSPVDGGAHQLRQGRPLPWRVVFTAQHRDRLEGQPLYGGDVSGAPPAALPLQRARARAREAAGRSVAGREVEAGLQTRLGAVGRVGAVRRV